MEIDVSKYKNCPYWHYGHCQNNIINVLNSECSVHQNCFIKKTLEQLQQLKQENEGLKSLNDFNVQKIETLEAENEKLKQDLQEETKLGHKAICEEADRFFEVMKLQKVLDKIEDRVQDLDNYSENNMVIMNDVLQLIKQAKEGK